MPRGNKGRLLFEKTMAHSIITIFVLALIVSPGSNNVRLDNSSPEAYVGDGTITA
jgi:hypothetical protein